MTTGTQSTIVAMFENRTRADQAIDALTSAGYTRDQISVITSDHRKSDPDTPNIGPLEEVGGGMTSGTGAAIGGIAGFIGGIVALAIPGIGPIIAAGPLAAGIMGAGVGAAAGGIAGALKEHGIPEEEAKRYSQAVGRGRVMVTVHTDSGRVDHASAILDRSGACDIDEPAERVGTLAGERVASRNLDLGPGPLDKQHERERRVNVYPGVTGAGPTPTT